MSFTYIMTNKPNGTLYLGSTTNLKQRTLQHKTATGDHFTGKYELHSLVWFEQFAELKSAQQQEWRMKKWPRQWKINLIELQNPTWRDLSEDFNK